MRVVFKSVRCASPRDKETFTNMFTSERGSRFRVRLIVGIPSRAGYTVTVTGTRGGAMRRRYEKAKEYNNVSHLVISDRPQLYPIWYPKGTKIRRT